MSFIINNEKNSMKYLLLFLMILATVILIPNAFAQEQINIPSWIKNNAEWWASDQIPDSTFLQGIEYLINEGIMVIPSTETSESSESQEVPAWIKNVAGWWATDAISEVEFVNGIQYLIKHGIIIVGDNSSCVSDLSETFGDSSDIIQDICDLHESSVYTELIPYVESSNLNSLGFRGPEFSEIKPPNTYRIFMVGGSTMIGSGESSDYTTIPGILQKMFDSDNSNLKKIEVINAGSSGANHITEYNLINQKLVTFSPDLVIVYDGWNDINRPLSDYELNVDNAFMDKFLRDIITNDFYKTGKVLLKTYFSTQNNDNSRINVFDSYGMHQKVELWKNGWNEFCSIKNDYNPEIIITYKAVTIENTISNAQ